MKPSQVKTSGIKPRMVSIPGAVAYSGDGRSTLYAAAKAGEIEFVKMGRATRVEISELDRYIDAKAKPAELAAQKNPTTAVIEAVSATRRQNDGRQRPDLQSRRSLEKRTGPSALPHVPAQKTERPNRS